MSLPLFTIMDRYSLPTSVEIDGVECKFNTDYRDILDVFAMLNEPNLLEAERVVLALDLFYTDDCYKINIETAIKEMFDFISQTDEETRLKENHNKKPLYDWEQDFNIIVPPVNKILGYDVRGKDYIHWWTFLSAFMEIGECTFHTYVSIRDKLNRSKKLEKWEERILKENRDKIILKQKVDETTQMLMDEILGV